MATDNGLCRFDGRRFKFYKNDPKDPTSIFSDQVFTVLPIGDEIWTGTLQGISVLNIHTHEFRNYQLGESGKVDSLTTSSRKDVLAILKDRQGDIWIGTKFMGLWKYDPEKDDFEFYAPSYYPDYLTSNFEARMVGSIEQSRTNDSIIWAGTSTGLMELNKYSRDLQFHHFLHEDKATYSGLNTIRSLYHHDDGRVYVSTWAKGAYYFDPVTKQMNLIQAVNDTAQLLSALPVSSVVPQSNETIWLTTGKGLFLYSTKENRILYKTLNDNRNKRYYGIRLLDKGQRYWYTNHQGLFLYDPYIQQFHTYSFAPHTDGETNFVFLQDYDAEKDEIVICPRVTKELYFFNRKNNTWGSYPFRNLSRYKKEYNWLQIYGFGQLGRDEYVLAAQEGLFLYRPSSGLLSPILNDPATKNIWFTSLEICKDGKLWAGSLDAGLFLVDPHRGTYSSFVNDFLIDNKLVSRIGDLLEDSAHNVWMKRMDGFSVYSRKDDKIHNFLFSVDPARSFAVVNGFAEDKYGRVWTCSEEGRMAYMEVAHPEKGIIAKTSIRDAGVEGHIYALISDPEGNIWGATNKEIFRIDREGRVVAHFSLKYSSFPIDFFGMSMLPDGQLVIGGRQEITLTYPLRLTRNKEVPKPYLTQISVRQKPHNAAYPMFGGAPLELRNNENFFSLAYAAQAYTFSENIRFRYRLKGLEEWIDAGDQLVANYTSVPPGDYTFQLMAANNEGIWNEAILEVPVIVNQAWFKSWWFLTLVALCLSVLVYSIFQYRIQQIRKEEKIKTAYERKLAGVEMSALVSQMNPHFLFNSLNSIDSYIIKNQSFKASEYLNKFAHLMRLILQNSRTTYISLENEISGLELYLQMECMRSAGGFTYNINIAPDVDVHHIEIPPMLIQPYVENAIWHGLRHLNGGEKGRVDISLDMHQEKLRIAVKDNGIGRVQSAILQKRKSGNHKKSMGMQITQNRIEMINKLYQAEASVVISDLYDSQGEAAGTQVTLTIAI